LKSHRHGTAARVARWIGRALAFLTLGVTLLVALLLVSINLPPVSGFVAAQVNSILEPQFQGRVALLELGHLDLGGISGAKLEVRDAADRPVLEAREVDVRMFWPGVAYGALTSKGPLQIPIEQISVGRLDVTVIDDGNGTPTLASAFDPKTPEPPSEGPAPSIRIARLELASAAVRGSLDSTGPLDVDLESLRAQLDSTALGLSLRLEQLGIVARGLPQVGDVSGRLTAEVNLPAEAEAVPSRAPSAPATAQGPPATQAISTQAYALRPPPAPRRVVADFAGQVAGSGIALQLQLIGEQILATLEAARIEPSTLTRLVPGLAPQAPLGVSAKLEGLLDDLGLDAQLRQEPGQATVHGRLRQEGERSHATLRFDGSDLDLAGLLPDMPKSKLGLSGDARLDSDPDGSHGSYHLVASGSGFDVGALPRTAVSGELQLPDEQPLRTTGTVNIDEPGARTRISYDVRARDAGVTAELTSKTELARPARLRALLDLRASGTLTTRVRYDGAADQLDAKLGLALRGVQHPAGNAARVDATLSARGRTSAPQLALDLGAGRVQVADRSFARVWLTARGTPERLALAAHATGGKPERIDARFTLAPNSARLVQGARVWLRNGKERLNVAARGVELDQGKLRVDGLTLDGPGRAQLSFRYGRQLEELELNTQGLDAARLLQALGIESPLRSAVVDLRAHLAGHGRAASGTIAGGIRQIAYGKLQGSLDGDLALERGSMNGKLALELARGGRTEVVLKDLRAPLGPLLESDLRQFTGEVSLAGDLQLERLQSLLPLLAVERAEGRVRYDISVRRSPHDREPPVWRAKLESRNLVLVGQRPDAGRTTDAETARQTAPWALRGVDVKLDARLDEKSARLRAKLFDQASDLLVVEADWPEIDAVRAVLKPEQVLRAPFRGRVSIPRRALAKWPASIRPGEIQGTLGLELEAEGTLADPRAHVVAHLDRFSPASERQRRRWVDWKLEADYASSGGRIHLDGMREQRTVLGLVSSWTGDARGFGSSGLGKSPILANAEIRLDEFPLGIVPALRTQHIRGGLTGRVSLTGFGKDARLDVDLRSRELTIDRLLVGELQAALANRGGKLELSAQLDGEGGQAKAKVQAPLVWGDQVVPTTNGQLQGTLETVALRLSTLQPLVEGSISELDGKLDANLNADIAQGRTQLVGTATLREGVLHVPSVGQRFTDIAAEVKLSPYAISIEKIKARGVTGGFEASAHAKLDGLNATSAEATLRIKEKNKLPITIEGESIGDAWGNVEAKYERDEAAHTDRVSVDLSKFNIELPEAPPQGIQDLAQPEYIRVGYRRQDREFVEIALQPLGDPKPPSDEQTVILVNLNSVTVQKGSQAKVDLAGKVEATLGDELDVQGRIDTKRGELDISGKTFDIERASVAFTGDAADPTIGAVARYDSPVGYSVYAEYTGTVSKGKLQLRAEPALSQDEIVTLLLFGTPDGSIGAGQGDSLSTAVGVAGGTAAQGLNRAISDVTNLDVSARVDTSTGAPRPELVVQVTPRVAAKVTQALGEPVPGQSPDRTFLTVDLRLATAWSLSTTVGDRGATAFDLIWRRRY